MKDTLLDLWDTFRYWVEDNKQTAAGIVVLIIFLVILVYVLLPKPEGSELVEGVKPYTIAEVEAMKEVSTELDNTFSLLRVLNEGSQAEYPAYTVSVYLKKPFITEEDLMFEVEKLIDIYKWKSDFRMAGMKIKIFDRKEVFDKDFEPRATMYYAKKLTEETIKEEEDGGSYVYGEDVQEMNFRETIEAGEDPDYGEYELNLGAFRAMDKKENIIPLSDQEFSFYLKMHLYNTLKDGSDYAGAQLYLQWDLGRSLTKGGVNSIVKEFRKFQDRHLELRGQREYIDNLEYVKRDLAVERPQFLLFAETNQVIDDPLEAQKELIKFNPDVYLKPLQEYIDVKSDDIADEIEEEEKRKAEEAEKETQFEIEEDKESEESGPQEEE